MSDAYGPEGRSAWLDVDWRAHQRWVPVRGRPVNVIVDGPEDAAQAVVLVHGLAGSWQNWLENIPVLAGAGRRVVALDLPGFGASPMPAEPIEIAFYADVLDEVLTALGSARPPRSWATRWAGTWRRSSRSATRRAWSGSCS